MANMEQTIIGARVSKPSFSGFPREGLAFLRSLKRNNRREWFQPRKDVYEEKVRKPMLELVDALNAALADFARNHITEPADSVYRVYRDTRFSADKTPYKTHIAAIFPRRGFPKHVWAGLYFSVSPEEVEIAGGAYMPQKDELRAIRRHLLENHDEFRRIAGDRTLRRLMGEVTGEQLSRVPKGFPADHPAADLIRYKQWYFDALLDPKLATTPKLYGEIVKRFRAMMPFIDFLNRPALGRKPSRSALLV